MQRLVIGLLALTVAAGTAGGCGASTDDGATVAGGAERRGDLAGPSTPPVVDDVEVPDVVGENAANAETTLDDEGLGYEFDPADPGDPSACAVDDQDPVGGDLLPEGDIVTLTVICEVPDVTGLDGQEAVDTLEGGGFSWYVDACDDELVSCTVSEQDLYEAEPGAEVSLTMDPGDPTGTGDVSGDCHPSYEGACLDPTSPDYDCEGGEGDGPDYVAGPIDVVGPDEYGLDRDSNGLACEA